MAGLSEPSDFEQPPFVMKTTLTFILLLTLGSIGRSQSIPMAELVGPNNTIRDPLYGITVQFPAGWEVRSAQRWGKNNQENTIFFSPLWPSEARPSLYYQTITNFDAPGPDAVEAHFRYTAGTKALQRINGGLADYKNLENTFELIQINGRPGFRYLATYTMGEKKFTEYFIRVLGDKLMAMFFIQAPSAEIETVRREVDQMASTILVP